MNNLEVPRRENAGNEGHIQVELEPEIRRRAYRLYEERGKADGHVLEDWAQAEAAIVVGKRKSTAAKKVLCWRA